MYSKIKKTLLKIVPKNRLFHSEYFLRYFHYLFYVGNKYQCNVCNKKLSNFIAIENDRICPRCGSSGRARRLWEIMNQNFSVHQSKILDFSPSRCIYRKMKHVPNYLGSDLSEDFLSDVSYDITAIDTSDEQYDLIICYHVLEHVQEDIRGMKELFRVLKRGGCCLVQTPFKIGEIYENSNITSPEDRQKHFGQFDHVRIYSVEGLKNRLESVNFVVEVKHFKTDYKNFHGFQTNETILFCHKPQ